MDRSNACVPAATVLSVGEVHGRGPSTSALPELELGLEFIEATLKETTRATGVKYSVSTAAEAPISPGGGLAGVSLGGTVNERRTAARAANGVFSGVAGADMRDITAPHALWS